MSKAIIISGEAPETDSEDETPTMNPTALKVLNCIQGAVVTGEDSESEEEFGSVSSAVSVLSNEQETSILTERNESLLHRKLRECNGKLRNDLENVCQSVINEAMKSMNAIDQQLLKSQIAMQSAVSSLKSINSNSFVLKNKLQSLLADRFIPNIIVKEDEEK